MGHYLTSRFNEVPRERWSFGQVLEWHLVRGTRPGGRLDRPGRRWTRAEFADRTGLGARTVGNWLSDGHLPPETETIERVLFGNDAGYAEWRLELRQAHAAGWGAKRDAPQAPGSKRARRSAAAASPQVADDPAASASARRQALPASNVPVRVPTHFTGREDELRWIDEGFARTPDRTAVLALVGMRGIGKTTLAAAYAERCRDRFRATWWIRAQSEPLMRADLVALGTRLGWSHPQEREDLAFSAVMERLIYEGVDVLLIYDNALDADSLAPCLPRGGAARVLVTSNFHAFRGLAEPLEVAVWDEDTGAGYLMRRIGGRGEARALSRALGGLPLAHEQAASYCERLGIPASEYLTRFERQPAPFLDDHAHAPVGYNGRMTVARSFTLGIEAAAAVHPGAEPVIVCAALMAPEPVPLFLFAETRREDFGEPLASALADGGLEEAVAALRSFALLKRETTADERDPGTATETVSLHRLVREVAAARREGAAQAAIRRNLVGALARLYPDGVYDDPATWPRARRLNEHARRLLESGEVPLAGIEEAASLLSDRLALYAQAAVADYAAARSHHVRALTLRETAFGAGHPLTATTLHHLARVFLDLGDYAAALAYYRRALAIRKRVLGPDDLDTAESINNMASVLQSQGRLGPVRALYERALAVRERVLGPDHPRTAASLVNIARVLRDQGRFAEALPFAVRGREIRERVLGDGHPRTAAALNVHARVLQGAGETAAAEPLLRRALAICEEVLGAEHPYTAATVTNLALLSRAQGDLSGARVLLERAHTVREKVLGPRHPATAASLEALARLEELSGRARNGG